MRGQFVEADTDGGVEQDAQGVLPGPQQVFDFFFPGDKEIVCPQDEGVVEIDIRIGVEPQELEVGRVVFEVLGIHAERELVLPVGFVHPLHVPFVGAVVGIFDFTVGHEIGMYRAGDGGRHPVFLAGLVELPVFM